MTVPTQTPAIETGETAEETLANMAGTFDDYLCDVIWEAQEVVKGNRTESELNASVAEITKHFKSVASDLIASNAVAALYQLEAQRLRKQKTR